MLTMTKSPKQKTVYEEEAKCYLGNLGLRLLTGLADAAMEIEVFGLDASETL